MNNPGNIILDIYERYNPEKISEVADLLEKYAGQEYDLIENIFNKYDVSKEERSVFLKSRGEVSLDQKSIINPAHFIFQIYERYNPDKLSAVPELLEKYVGQEEDLIENIISKYSISLEEKTELQSSAEKEFYRNSSLESQSSIVENDTIIKEPENVILSIYERYNPNKISDVKELLDKYFGQEDELIENIFDKYDVSEEERSMFLKFSERVIVGKSSTEDEQVKVENELRIKNPAQVIIDLYNRYNPEKLSLVKELLEKYEGQEDELIENIFDKYDVTKEERILFIQSAESKLFNNNKNQEGTIVEKEVETEIIKTPEIFSAPENVISTVPDRSEFDVTNIGENSIPKNENKKGKNIVFWFGIIFSILIIIGSTTFFLQYKGIINLSFFKETVSLKANTKVPAIKENKKVVSIIKKKVLIKKAIKVHHETVDFTQDVPVQKSVELKNTEYNTNTVKEPKKVFKYKKKNELNSVSNSGMNFYIIAGSYKSMMKAEEAVNKLKLKQFIGAQIVDKNESGNIRICFKAYSSREEAMLELEPIRQNENPTAWVYNKK
jgi:hypothetical protein